MDGLAEDEAGPHVHFVKKKMDFADMITKLLASETEEKIQKRIEGIRGFSWDNLFSMVERSFYRIIE